MICETRPRPLPGVGSTVIRVKGGGRLSISEVSGTMMIIGYGSSWSDWTTMEDSRRIRQLAARHFAPEAIAAQLELRPAIVRRVLGRSEKRGAPRKREASATLSFVTTPEVAEKIRAAAAAEGVPVSSVIDDLVQTGLRKRKTASKGTARSVTSMKPVGDIPKSRG